MPAGPRFMVTVAFILVTAAAVNTAAQDLRTGTKRAEEQVVVWQEVTGPANESATAIPAAVEETWQAAEDEGLTMIGPVHLVMTGDTPQTPQDNMTWEVQIPIADDVTEEDYPAGDIIQVKTIPERVVAYTFYAGPMGAAVWDHVLTLFQWIADNGLDVAGPLRMIAYTDPTFRAEGGFAELQVEVAER